MMVYVRIAAGTPGEEPPRNDLSVAAAIGLWSVIGLAIWVVGGFFWWVL